MRSHPLIAALALSSLAVGQIPLPKNTTSYTSTRARGFFFKAPAPFIVTHVQVPDESANGLQAVALYKLNAAPPAYSSTINATPVFYKDGVSSDQYIPVLPPIQVKKDEVFVALGVTYAQNSNRYTSSYGAAQFSSSILGNAITLQRCGTQDDFVGLQGAVTLWSEVSGSNGRVRVFALSQGEARIFGIGSGTGTPPQMLVSDEKPPMIGSSGEFFVQANASNLAGVLLLSTGKLNVPVPPFGNLLLSLPLIGTFPLGPISTSTPLSVSVPIPKDNNLVGVPLTGQAFMVNTATSFAMSDGLQWRIGL